jgi:hypothetical protein
MFFEGTLGPAGGRLVPRDSPGNGLTLRTDVAGAYQLGDNETRTLTRAGARQK